MYFKNILLLLSLFFGAFTLQAQDCADGEDYILVSFNTDNYGYEFSWSMHNLAGDTLASSNGITYDNNTLYEEDFCFTQGECYELRLSDSYGDGLTGSGYFNLVINGEVVFEVGNFGSYATFNFSCPPGFSCNDPIATSEGIISQSQEEFWYSFTPSQVGKYEFSTCDNEMTCNSTIWIYDNCNIEFTDDNQGTLFFNDSSDECLERAILVAALESDRTYLVRIRKDGACGDLNINFNYQGPVVGCTNPNSCNYNALATVDDGSCIEFGNPECPDGPDLVLNQSVLETSIYLETVDFADNTDYNCLIEENCLKGVGVRDLIRFDTRIENNGTLDYVIGQITEESDQFTFDNCHNHWHYDGYAEYSLYDEFGQYIPIGYKNGFCVLDLECPAPGMAKFGCDNMGITAGCVDTYHAYLDCQWLDVTDVPDGNYIFIAVVNADFAPDVLGRVEKDSLNNWAQVCLNISRATGDLEFTVVSDCDPFYDCAGELYGRTQPDCTGECGGSAIRGDYNKDQELALSDVSGYINAVMENTVPEECTDLYKDGVYNVYDASLLLSCLRNGQEHNHPGGTSNHDHCFFPAGLYNHLDTMFLDFNYEAGNDYFDINITNPRDGLFAFQIALDGVNISKVVQNTPEITDQIFDFHVDPDRGMIMGLSASPGMSLPRSIESQGFLRIYVESAASEICLIDNSVMVSELEQSVAVGIDNTCFMGDFSSSTDEILLENKVVIRPVPTSNFLDVDLSNTDVNFAKYMIHNVDGRVIEQGSVSNNKLQLTVREYLNGVYFITLNGEGHSVTKKFIVHDDKE